MTVIQDNFEWDNEKNEINKKKHGLLLKKILKFSTLLFSLKS